MPHEVTSGGHSSRSGNPAPLVVCTLIDLRRRIEARLIMPFLTTSDTRNVLDVAHELTEAACKPEQLVAEALIRVTSLLHADTSCFNLLDLATGTATVTTYPNIPQFAEPAKLLGTTMHDHPMMIHWALRPTDLEPVRISDLVSQAQLRRTSTFDRVLRPMGTPNMLGVPLRFSATSGEGYAVKRSGRDFSDHDRDLAFALQIALVVLHRRARSEQQPIPEADDSGVLTPRESQVLSLVGRGLTADAIGRSLSISPKTVRKHLEHVYRKLNTNDRLMAVDLARQNNLIPRSN